MSSATQWAPPEPASLQFSNELTAQSVCVSFNSLPYAHQSIVLETLQKIHDKRREQLIAAAPKVEGKVMPPLVHEGDALKAERLADQGKKGPKAVTLLAPIEEMLKKPHPHIGKSKPWNERMSSMSPEQKQAYLDGSWDMSKDEK